MGSFWILLACLLSATVDSKPMESNETVPIPKLVNETDPLSACYHNKYCITCEINGNNLLKNCYVHLCLIIVVFFVIALIYTYWNDIYRMMKKYKQKKMAAAYEEIE